MGEFYIFSSGRLKRRDNTLYFEGEKGSRFIPVENTKEIYVFSEVDLNSRVLNFLSQNGIILHVFNYYGYYSGSFIPRASAVSGFLTVKQAEHYLDEEKRCFLAASFVEGAIFHAVRNLRKRGVDESELEELRELPIEAYRAGSVPEIMAVEGRAKGIYYSLFDSLIENQFFKMGKREKRPPSNPTNALISFVNSLIYTVTLSEIYKTQLAPTISYLHEPSTGRFSLSLDISEIFKPLIGDSVILSLIKGGKLTKKDFDSSLNYAYLTESGRKKVVSAIKEKLKTTVRHRKLKRNVSYRYLIRLECYKLIKHLIGEITFKPLKAWW